MVDGANREPLSMADKTVVHVIGEGADGRALLCTDNVTSGQVVVKGIPLSGLSRREQDEAKQETESLRRLNHPNIINCRGSFVEDGALRIVMDFADAGDLFEAIQNANRAHFSEEQTLHWFVQICVALKHIHDRKILHRDMKCQNVFLTRAGW
jgi:NIMA (never in mitosis gene a)-related kinase